LTARRARQARVPVRWHHGPVPPGWRVGAFVDGEEERPVTSMRDHWEQHAGDWIRWARTPGHDFWHSRFNWPRFQELLPPPGRLTVDLGCGEGRLLRELGAMGHRVVGVDRSPRMAAAAAAAGGGVPVLLADAARLPLRDGGADLVVAYMSLLNMDDLPGAVGEVGRVLAPGGRLCLSVVHPLASTLGREADDAMTLVRSYFEPDALIYAPRRDTVPMTFYDRHLPLESYFAALGQAGLLVEALREPRPDPAAVADHPQLARRSGVPTFLHVRALKPGAGQET
jgi:SAM-dependent methyltransferase